MHLKGWLRGALALLILRVPAWTEPPNPGVESWGAYDVRHMPLTPVEHGMVALLDSTVAVPSRNHLYFFRPDGGLVGQFFAEGQIGGPPVVLRDGGIAIYSFTVDEKAGTVSHKVVILGPDRRKRGGYVFDSQVEGLTALSDGGAAGGVTSGRHLVFLRPDGGRLERLSLEACWKHPRTITAVVELPDGRLLLRDPHIHPESACVVSPDRKKAYLWTIKNGRARSSSRWTPPSWRLKSGVLVGTDADGLAFMDAKGAVLRRTKAPVGETTRAFTESEGLRDGRVWLTELRDGSVAVGSAVNGLVLVTDGQGRERWRFKASGAIGGEPLELSNGNIVVGSEDHAIYFFGQDGTLLGRYQTEGKVQSRLLELKDGTILAAIGRSEGASHNLLLFTPTGRSFVSPAPVSGKRCRVVRSSKFWDFLNGRRNCPTDPDSLPAVRRNYSWIESLCVTEFPGSRTTHLQILGCKIIPPTKGKPEPFTLVVPQLQTEVTVAYDCEVCSDEPAPTTPMAPASR